MEEEEKLNKSTELAKYNFTGISSLFSYGNVSDNIDAKEEATPPPKGSWGPTLLKPMTQKVNFVPDSVFLLGSPIGLFLSLRGAHQLFNHLRTMQTIQEKPIEESISPSSPSLYDTSPFTLPCSSIYNIFHPSDPVAYRIEPLLLPIPTPANAIPPPCFLATEQGGIRLHIQAMQFGDNLTRRFTAPKPAVDASSSSAGSAEGAATPTISKSFSSIGSTSEIMFPLGGKSGRVDFQLQQGLIGNDYLSSLNAHTTYFSNDDVINFIIEVASSKKKVHEDVETQEEKDLGKVKTS